MFGTKKERHSPLKEAPLRQAGQSLDEEISRRWDEMLEYLIVSVVVAVLAGFEWWRWYFNSPPNPWLLTSLALVVCAYCGMRIVPLLHSLRKLKQGRDGERVIGHQLEALRAQGFKVLHDVPGDGWNIDHVLIGIKGIYCVETKTISKQKGETEITYDGQQVRINGLVPDRNPIIQVKSASRWLHDFIKRHTGKDFLLRPVLLYPGWFVSKQPSGSDVWVLNEKVLPAFLEHEHVKCKTQYSI